jgi:hypothetical protein
MHLKFKFILESIMITPNINETLFLDNIISLNHCIKILSILLCCYIIMDITPIGLDRIKVTKHFFFFFFFFKRLNNF